jgi:hypothetical protein
MPLEYLEPLCLWNTSSNHPQPCAHTRPLPLPNPAGVRGRAADRGPELVSLPTGASVTPLGGRLEVPVYLNGREIARAVAADVTDRRARR